MVTNLLNGQEDTASRVIDFSESSLLQIRQDWIKLSSASAEYLLGNWSIASKSLLEVSSDFSKRGRHFLSSLLAFWAAESLRNIGEIDHAIETYRQCGVVFAELGAYEYACDSLRSIAPLRNNLLDGEPELSLLRSIRSTAYYLSDFRVVDESLRLSAQASRRDWLSRIKRISLFEKQCPPITDSNAARLLKDVQSLWSLGFIHENAWPKTAALWYGRFLVQKGAKNFTEWIDSLHWEMPDHAKNYLLGALSSSAATCLCLNRNFADNDAIQRLVISIRQWCKSSGQIDMLLMALRSVSTPFSFLPKFDSFESECAVEAVSLDFALHCRFDWSMVETLHFRKPRFGDYDRVSDQKLQTIEIIATLCEKAKEEGNDIPTKLELLSKARAAVQQLGQVEFSGLLAYIELWCELLKSNDTSPAMIDQIWSSFSEAAQFNLSIGNIFGTANMFATGHDARRSLIEKPKKHIVAENALLSRVAGYELLLEQGNFKQANEMGYAVAADFERLRTDAISQIRPAFYLVASEQERLGNKWDCWPVTRAAAHTSAVSNDRAANIRHLQLAADLYRRVGWDSVMYACQAAAKLYRIGMVNDVEVMCQLLHSALRDYESMSLGRPSLEIATRAIESFLNAARNPMSVPHLTALEDALHSCVETASDAALISSVKNLKELAISAGRAGNALTTSASVRLLTSISDGIATALNSIHIPYVAESLSTTISEKAAQVILDGVYGEGVFGASHVITREEITHEVVSNCIESFQNYFHLHGQAWLRQRPICEKELQHYLVLWLQARLPTKYVTLREVELGRGRGDIVIVEGAALYPIEVKLYARQSRLNSATRQLEQYMTAAGCKHGCLVIFYNSIPLKPANHNKRVKASVSSKISTFEIIIGAIPSSC